MSRLVLALMLASCGTDPVCDEPYLLDCPGATTEMRGCCTDDACWYQTDTVAILCDDSCDDAGELMVLIICGPPPGLSP